MTGPADQGIQEYRYASSHLDLKVVRQLVTAAASTATRGPDGLLDTGKWYWLVATQQCSASQNSPARGSCRRWIMLTESGYLTGRSIAHDTGQDSDGAVHPNPELTPIPITWILDLDRQWFHCDEHGEPSAAPAPLKPGITHRGGAVADGLADVVPLLEPLPDSPHRDSGADDSPQTEGPKQLATPSRIRTMLRGLTHAGRRLSAGEDWAWGRTTELVVHRWASQPSRPPMWVTTWVLASAVMMAVYPPLALAFFVMWVGLIGLSLLGADWINPREQHQYRHQRRLALVASSTVYFLLIFNDAVWDASLFEWPWLKPHFSNGITGQVLLFIAAMASVAVLALVTDLTGRRLYRAVTTPTPLMRVLATVVPWVAVSTVLLISTTLTAALWRDFS